MNEKTIQTFFSFLFFAQKPFLQTYSSYNIGVKYNSIQTITSSVGLLVNKKFEK